MKYLFVVILNKNENAYRLFSELRKHDIKGTVLPAQSLKSAYLDNDDEALPLFGSLRQVVSYPHDLNYTVFCIVTNEQLALVKSIVHEITDEIQHKLGVMFALPVDTFEEETK